VCLQVSVVFIFVMLELLIGEPPQLHLQFSPRVDANAQVQLQFRLGAQMLETHLALVSAVVSSRVSPEKRIDKNLGVLFISNNAKLVYAMFSFDVERHADKKLAISTLVLLLNLNYFICTG
jgi:hypothetical protein